MNTPYFPDFNEETLKYVCLREEDVINLKHLKTVLVKSQLYAEAAHLRDLEKRMIKILEAMATHGFKPKPAPQGEEKVYTIGDVTHMLNLATAPLKKTIAYYEELSRTAIVDHVAGLMKQIDELKKQNNESKAEAKDAEEQRQGDRVNDETNALS